jgi:hypothetical protein
MASSGMLRRVSLVRTDDSEELSANVVLSSPILIILMTLYFFAACVGC